VSASLGILGLRGEGSGHQAELAPLPFAVIGDFGASLGLFGGFVASSALLTALLEERSRSFVTEAMMPQALAGAIEAAIEVVELAHGAREDLRQKSQILRRELELRKFHYSSPTAQSPIICLPFPRLSAAKKLANAMYERGYYLETSEPRLQRNELCYLRVLLTVSHTERQIQDLVGAIFELSSRIFSK
jgi:7-keto-8-aminopelargonate synthetase-like enzyme